MASVRLTETQTKKIKETGLTTSEFIRRAVDYYLDYLDNPYNDGLLSELETWIKIKRNCNTDVTHNNTDVLDNNTDVTHMNTLVTHNNTDVLDNNTDVLICNTNTKETTQKTQNNTKETIKTKLTNEAEMLQRILNNPLNNETIPDNTLKLLSKKYDLSKSTIQSFITENKTALKEGKFGEI